MSLADDVRADMPARVRIEDPDAVREVVEARSDAPAWQRRYQRLLMLLDLLVIASSTLIADAARFGSQHSSFNGYSYVAFSVALVPIWLFVLLASRGYEIRYLGTGADEFKRVGSASIRLIAAIAFICYLWRLELARGYVAIAFPVGTALLLGERYLARRWLHHQRRVGRCLHRVVVVGGNDAVSELANQFHREAYAGFRVVGACVPVPSDRKEIGEMPVVGSLTQVLAAVKQADADTVAVVSGPGMSPTVLRRLSWELEGTGVDLVVAPTLTDVAGPRINIRPVAGLPLLHVDEPELSGMRQWFKSFIEWVAATVASVLLAPLLLVLIAIIRIDSPGSPLFRQTRVGKHGQEFTVYKLRTMRADAETLLETLHEQNENADGLLFKMKADPRITRVGRLLRKWSLDELPQLWNVVRGDMAIVGPRPPLPAEVAQYGSDVARRLLVRPGITGLWQVSGRSDLSWDDSVRLDLYYVENWSLAMDAMIIWKTLFAVLQGAGAY